MKKRLPKIQPPYCSIWKAALLKHLIIFADEREKKNHERIKFARLMIAEWQIRAFSKNYCCAKFLKFIHCIRDYQETKARNPIGMVLNHPIRHENEYKWKITTILIKIISKRQQYERSE